MTGEKLIEKKDVYDQFIFSPGTPERTIIIQVKDIDKILDNIDNELLFY